MELILKNRAAASGRIDPARTALIALHWQNDVLDPAGAFGPIFGERASATGLVERMQRLVAASRDAGVRVVYVNVAYAPGHGDVVRNNALFRTSVERNAFVRGTRGARVVDALAPGPGDRTVEHGRISAFYGTELDLVLRSGGVRTVAVAGIATNVAVDHTVRDAVQMGYETIVIEDACCSSDDALHQAAMLTLRVLASDVRPAADFIRLLGPQ